MTTPQSRKLFKVGPVGVRVRTTPSTTGIEVRRAPGGEILDCDANTRTVAENYIWWQHRDGWSAAGKADGSEVYMTEQLPAPAAEVSSLPVASEDFVFKIGNQMVRVRQSPSINGAMVRWLNPGDEITAKGGSRTEADGFVWWQHAEGWSAERSLTDETLVFLYRPLPPAPPAATTPAETTPQPAVNPNIAPPAAAPPADATPAPTVITEIPAAVGTPVPAVTVTIAPPSSTPPPAVGTPTPPTDMLVNRNSVRVRQSPSLSGAMIRWLDPGTKITTTARHEAEGYIWRLHNDGWTAERSQDGSQIFLVDPTTFDNRPDQTAPEQPNAGAPNLRSLPQINNLFSRLPVSLDQTQWWQYFGNNVFAFNLYARGKTWYKYCQLLHGGVDFGNSITRGVPIYAGVSGRVTHVVTNVYQPNGIFVKSGDFTIIYGHTANPRVQIGSTVTPDTQIGEVQVPGQEHLHLEVRYKEVWIVNPLEFFPENLSNQIIAKFPPGARYFYRDASWDRWQTPYDQPVLKLGGSPLGPHAGR